MAEGGTREEGDEANPAGGSGRGRRDAQPSAEAEARRAQVASETGDISASRRESEAGVAERRRSDAGQLVTTGGSSSRSS